MWETGCNRNSSSPPSDLYYQGIHPVLLWEIESTFRCLYIQPSLLLSTWCAGSVCVRDTMCMSFSFWFPCHSVSFPGSSWHENEGNLRLIHTFTHCMCFPWLAQTLPTMSCIHAIITFRPPHVWAGAIYSGHPVCLYHSTTRYSR